MKTSSFRLQFISAFLGNLFEHYDVALYTLLTPFFASMFFSEQDPISALILTYGIIPLSMLARPLGAIFFGYIGDGYGRHQALFLSLLGMGVVSGLLALVPTYDQVGRFAPLFLLLGRVLQNFFGIGENLGGAIFLLEHTDEKKQDFVSSLYSSSTVAGILLASIGVSVLIYFQNIETYWRLLYVFGCVTGFFGCILRNQMSRNRVREYSPSGNFTLNKLLSSFWVYRKVIVLIALASGFSYANWTISLVFFNGFIPLVTNISKEQMTNLNTGLLFFDFMILPLFGLLAARFCRQNMMLAAALCTVICAIPLFSLIEGAVLSTIVVVRILIVMFGVWFAASFHSWAQKLVPEQNRYAVITFAYSIGSQLLGGPTAAISLWLFQQTGVVWTASLYWIVLAGATAAGLALTARAYSENSTQRRKGAEAQRRTG